MARSRGVTRQWIQSLVDELKRRGLVSASKNPAHRRSVRIELTQAGATLIARMRQRELDLLGRIGIDLQAPRIRQALQTLDEIRGKLLAARAAEA
jgi:DNA-binding MarR family transcriptional regulator